MDELKFSDMHWGMAGFNVGMIGFGVLDGDTGITALNTALLPMNLGLAASGRKEEIGNFKESVAEMPEKGLGRVYDSALRNRVASSVEGIASDGDYGSRRVSRRRC